MSEWRVWHILEFLTGIHNGESPLLGTTPKFKLCPSDTVGAIKVIEHAALVEAQQKISQLEAELEAWRNDSLVAENARLREALEGLILRRGSAALVLTLFMDEWKNDLKALKREEEA